MSRYEPYRVYCERTDCARSYFGFLAYETGQIRDHARWHRRRTWRRVRPLVFAFVLVGIALGVMATGCAPRAYCCNSDCSWSSSIPCPEGPPNLSPERRRRMQG